MRRTHRLFTSVYSQRLGEQCQCHCHPTRCCVLLLTAHHYFFIFFFFFTTGDVLTQHWARGEACGKTTVRGSLGIAPVQHLPSCFHLALKHTDTAINAFVHMRICHTQQIHSIYLHIKRKVNVIWLVKCTHTHTPSRKVQGLHCIWFSRPHITAGTQAGPICF